MKNYFILLSLLISTELFSQCPVDNDTTRKIKVFGNAEIVLQPSSYVLEINLKESYLQPRNYTEKSLLDDPIDSLEMKLKGTIAAIGLNPKELKLLSITSMPNNMGNLEPNLTSANYELKIVKADDVNKFLKNTKVRGLTGIRIRRLFDVDKNAIRLQLGVDALKDSKQKAENLLSSVNKKVGDILLIDLNNYSNPGVIDDPVLDGNNGYYGQNFQILSKTVTVMLAVTYKIVD